MTETNLAKTARTSALVSSTFQFPNYCLLKSTWHCLHIAWHKTVPVLFKCCAPSNLCSLTSLIAYSPTFKMFQRSPASRPVCTSLSFFSHWEGLCWPRIRSINWLTRLSQMFEWKTSLVQHQNYESLTSSAWFTDLTCEVTKAFSHPCCRDVGATDQSMALEPCAGTFQKRFILVQILREMHYIHSEFWHRN